MWWFILFRSRFISPWLYIDRKHVLKLSFASLRSIKGLTISLLASSFNLQMHTICSMYFFRAYLGTALKMNRMTIDTLLYNLPIWQMKHLITSRVVASQTMPQLCAKPKVQLYTLASAILAKNKLKWLVHNCCSSFAHLLTRWLNWWREQQMQAGSIKFYSGEYVLKKALPWSPMNCKCFGSVGIKAPSLHPHYGTPQRANQSKQATERLKKRTQVFATLFSPKCGRC